MADDEIDLIWLNQNEGDGSEPPANDNFVFLWEDGEPIAWEDGETVGLELDENVETTAITMEDGQPITTESGEQLLMEAA